MKKRAKQPAPDASAAARAFERFALSGYRQTRFTDALYRALHLSFGFIAHFDRGGFYRVRFEDLAGRVETLRQMTDEQPWHNRPEEVALRAVVTRLKLVDAAEKELAAETEAAERAELARLKAKYPEATP